MSKSLAEMAAEVHAVNVEKGWFDSDRTFGDGIALLHSELSEALEAFRDHSLNDATANPAICRGEGCARPDLPHDGDWVHLTLAKPEGVGSEFADILIRLLDQCVRDGIDLQFEYERKLAYNRTRPYQHGGRAL